MCAASKETKMEGECSSGLRLIEEIKSGVQSVSRRETGTQLGTV